MVASGLGCLMDSIWLEIVNSLQLIEYACYGENVNYPMYEVIKWNENLVISTRECIQKG